jgi:hypothetical protein
METKNITASEHKATAHRCGVGIHQMPDVLRDSLRNEQNCDVFSDLSKLEKSLFNILLIGSSFVTNVKICALSTCALPNS